MTDRKRHKRIRKKKHTSPSSVRLGVLITVLVFIVIAAGVLMAPFFNVTEVYCEGNINVKTEDVIISSQIENGKHILLVNLGKAENKIEDIPLVKEASIRRIFPNKICVKISERVPAAYVMRGAECIAIDTEGVVIDIIADGRAAAIEKEFTPEDTGKKHEEEKAEDKKTAKKSSEKEDAETTDNKGEEKNESSEGSESSESSESSEGSEEAPFADKPFNVPLVSGIEIAEAEKGKNIKIADKEKLDKLIVVSGALNNAGLLSRATYINIENTSDIRIIIEKRLDIYIGGTDNIDYRTKFLAEVVNNKISSYENVVMDYRGDDIFVRPPDDGKDRIIKPKETEDEESDKTDEDKSDEDTDASEEEDYSGTNEENDNDSEEEEEAREVESHMTIE